MSRGVSDIKIIVKLLTFRKSKFLKLSGSSFSTTVVFIIPKLLAAHPTPARRCVFGQMPLDAGV